MNTDDPHLKCHLMSQIILHICPHHHVVVLNLRCRRSCHNANENLRNDCSNNVWHRRWWRFQLCSLLQIRVIVLTACNSFLHLMAAQFACLGPPSGFQRHPQGHAWSQQWNVERSARYKLEVLWDPFWRCWHPLWRCWDPCWRYWHPFWRCWDPFWRCWHPFWECWEPILEVLRLIFGCVETILKVLRQGLFVCITQGSSKE